jgi:hypothetical protein
MISKSGAWYSISCVIDNKDDPVIKSWLIENNIDINDKEQIEKTFKFQGMENVSSFLQQNEVITQFIYEQIKELII